MSASSAARAYPAPARPYGTTTAPTPARQPAPPRLRLVRAPSHARTRVPFVLVCMGVLAAALLGALLLNTQMAKNSYEKYDLGIELGRLDQDAKDLSAALDAKGSPSQLAKAASALGMVPSEGTGWIRLSDGTVQGAAGGR
ncbi:hypothetical protein [Cellulomonas palmilytica]|uniref:hypothetical protein n=1 Tax=Cellulomonas palmilytica TaxID=2608402 RepID=UPI001F2F3817|nr:hypothetical protein [Cellulomonas palmilytica]UJP38766.1 hypothetical protein F1D97_10120 [Cellulomonas palmilytica]